MKPRRFCPVPLCPVPIAPRFLMCREHWRQVPKLLRRAVNLTARAYDEHDPDSRKMHLDACLLAIRSLTPARRG